MYVYTVQESASVEFQIEFYDSLLPPICFWVHVRKKWNTKHL